MSDSHQNQKGLYVYFLPNLFTTANLAAGFLSLIASLNGEFEKAVYAVFVGAVFDSLDGRIARLAHAESQFGEQYDSLSDLVSFGLAPAVLAYQWALSDFGRPGYLCAFLFALCGALRLARFNVTVQSIPKSYFQGLPIPIAGISLLSGWLFSQDVPWTFDLKIPVFALTAFLAVLMVSTIKFPSFKKLDLENRQMMGVFLLTVIVLMLIALRHELMLFIFLMGYIFLSIAWNIRNHYRGRRRRKKNLAEVFYHEPSLVSGDDEDDEDTGFSSSKAGFSDAQSQERRKKSTEAKKESKGSEKNQSSGRQDWIQ
jgi:CDP-diacylglycerol--serine O-phosphatidyltransferase